MGAIKRFREKPAEVESIQFKHDRDVWDELERFMGKGLHMKWNERNELILIIHNSNTQFEANVDDWIVGDNGVFYPYKPNVFECLYEEVEDKQNA